jgi:RNA polymerase sigma factor (sigma-70 family)
MSNKQPSDPQADDHNTTSAPAKNFGLSLEAFNELKTQLKAGDEELFETIFLAHFEDCLKYIKNKFGIQHEKAYDITMDTLLLFRRKLLEDKISYGNIRFLFTYMAGQLYLKEIDRQPKKTSMSGENNSAIDLEEELLGKEELDLLSKAWEKLGTNCKDLLARFYYQKFSLKEIAEEQQRSDAALRKQKQRCLEKLRQHFKNMYPNLA